MLIFAHICFLLQQMFDARDPVVAVGIIALIIKMITTYAPLMFCGRYVML